ncbi:MAG: CHC2 zinc finger domain-containing protein, partial [Floccifex sp.]
MKEIRKRADIIDIVSQYVTLEKKGKEYRCICPFHNDHDPS